MKLENRTILITGGTSGIGYELAKQLISMKNTVIITGRDEQKLDKVKKELPEVQVFKSDVSNPASIQDLHARLLAEFPDLSVLINNAGIMRNLDLNESRDLLDVTREIEINLNGPIRMIQLFLPHLKSVADGLIVNVSSGLAFVPFPLSPVYSATKAGIHAYTRILRVQLEKSSIKVIELMPPGTETKLFRDEFQTETKNMKAMPVTELVQKAIKGIESGQLEIRPGQSNQLKIMSRVAPEFILNQMAKMIKKN